MNLAFFDFDGTITTREMLPAFVYSEGRRSVCAWQTAARAVDRGLQDRPDVSGIIAARGFCHRE